MIPLTVAMLDPKLFGPWFCGPSWAPWREFLGVVMGEAPGGDLFRACTGLKVDPETPPREVWVPVGRRGGKSRISALVATYLACFRKYDRYLAPGEIGTLPVIAADRKQARTIMRYIAGFFDAIPMLRRMVVRRTAEMIELRNRTVIEVHTASFRSSRGYTLIGTICDEIAFWRAENSANPDKEIIKGLRPGLTTIPGALLLAISSPYSRRGALWDVFRRHHGVPGRIMVWQTSTRAMNPTIDPEIIRQAYEEDPEAAAAEWGGEFRHDIESFVSQESVDAAVIPDRMDLPPTSEADYTAFVDPSGGGADSMTLAIAHCESHHETSTAVVDLVREVRPPFSPEDVVRDFVRDLTRYDVRAVIGDRYAGLWPRERFALRGVDYECSPLRKSDIYRDMLPLLNSARVELPDNRRLVHQLTRLERRTGRGVRETIDHPPGGHDDVINAVAGAVVMASGYDDGPTIGVW